MGNSKPTKLRNYDPAITITEGFGLSILESSAAGTPTVAYSVSGVRNVIEDQRNCLLIPDGNVDLFVDSISEIINNYPSHWIQSSREVSMKYSWDTTAKLWEEVLGGLV